MKQKQVALLFSILNFYFSFFFLGSFTFYVASRLLVVLLSIKMMGKIKLLKDEVYIIGGFKNEDLIFFYFS